MSTETHPIRVRVPPKTMEWLAAQARKNCRSMNGEINFRLEAAMAADRPDLVELKPKPKPDQA